MKLSKKCEYALKSIFELAWRNSGEPVRTHDIAASQRISARFAEVILNELKHGGFVESKRGNEGGYFLARDAKDLSVGEIIEYIEGAISVVPDAEKAAQDISIRGAGAFAELWQEVNSSIWKVCQGKSFADLVESARVRRDRSAPNYTI